MYKRQPISYPLRYSNGYYPAAGTKDEISPYVLLNYTGNAREQNTRNLVTLGITQDLSMITKGPVSYTHLIPNGIIKDEIYPIQKKVARKFHLKLVDLYSPVSYTHLDVYKRQYLICSGIGVTIETYKILLSPLLSPVIITITCLIDSCLSLKSDK